MKVFNIFRVLWKIQFLGGELQKAYIMVGLSKKGGGGLGQFTDLREGSLARKRRVVFLRVLILRSQLWLRTILERFSEFRVSRLA